MQEKKINNDEFGAERRPRKFVFLDLKDDRAISSKNILHG